MKNPKKKKKDFIKTPTYPGGKKAFSEYIRKNLIYPEEALENNIEGDVLVSYEVSDNGAVLNAKIKHGIGYGCDEEALRLIKSLKFPKTTNRGLRVKSKFTSKIPFRIKRKPAQTQFSYNLKPTKKKKDKPSNNTNQKSHIWKIDVRSD